ncbi:MAG: PASTA domain-containing protein [Clostridia bacterium]|nr:PASTA domain-containing protein [Clostridia bacterium]
MKKDTMRIKTKKRMLVLMGLFLVALVVLAGRVAWIQTVESEKLQKMAYDQQTRDRTINSSRGTIYSSDNKVLAISASMETISVTPSQVANAAELSQKLADLLGLEYNEVYEKVTSKAALVTIAKNVEKDVTDILREWINETKTKGVKIDETNKRYYPNNRLAAHVLGFVGSDNQGLYGIEKSYEDVLTGIPGRVISETDGKGNDIPFSSEEYYAPQNGRDLVLSIDSSIQYFTEKALAPAVIDNDCVKGGVAIVMKPSTGDVLAMAVYPDYDPNEAFGPYDEEQAAIWDSLDATEKKKLRESAWRNKAISDTYEPGSTFKVITTSAALDSGTATLDDHFTCVGRITVGGATMKCWRYYRPHGVQTFTEALGNSCNPAFIQLGVKMGKETFYKYIDAFGFTEKTGIELPGEATGVFHAIQNVHDTELATAAFGQRFNITPISLIAAISAVANDGKLMVPRIVKEVRDSDGNTLYSNEPKVVRQVISKETSEKVRGMMEKVVSEGTGGNAYIKGYEVGGKTGTAEQGIGASTWYVASFVGIAPANNPEIAVLVALFDPKGPSHGGGAIAAPVTKQIIEETLRYLQIQPNNADEMNTGVIVPEVRGLTVAETRTKLKEAGLKYNFQGTYSDTSIVKDQIPKPNIEVLENSSIILYTEENAEKTMVEVPNVYGKTISEATALLKNVGLNVNTDGLGVADEQIPAAGTAVEKGSLVKVTFKIKEVD